MAAIAIKGSMGSGHGSFPPRPSIEGEALITVNGIPVMVDGDHFDKHTDGNSTHDGVALSSRPWFSINGKGICCVGDKISCGSTIATGDALIQID